MERVTTTDTEIRQAARNLHDEICDAIGRESQDIFDHPTPFDPGKHVFHDDARTGEKRIEEPIPPAQCLALRLFLGCLVRAPLAQSPASLYLCRAWH